VPFGSPGDAPLTISLKHVSEPLPPPRQFAPDLPQMVEQVIVKSLEKDPDKRYQSATEMIDALNTVNMALRGPSVGFSSAFQAVAPSFPPPPASVEQGPVGGGQPSTPVSPLPPGQGVACFRCSALNLAGKMFCTACGYDLSGRRAQNDRALAPFQPAFPAPPVDALRFAAFYPKEVAVETWNTLLVYTHIASAVSAVRADAAKFEPEPGMSQREATSTAAHPVARGVILTIVPLGQGLTFNPPTISFQWLEDWFRAQFRFQVSSNLSGSAINGEVNIYAGPLLMATIKMSLLCEDWPSAASLRIPDAEATANAYQQQQIFTSYSHQDTSVVEACRNAYVALGLDVLRDLDTLRSGQVWNKELERMIDRSTIFQLFWSKHAAQSDFVRQEWEYALKCQKGEGFIRPVYWNQPMDPQPPEPLAKFHFKYMPLVQSSPEVGDRFPGLPGRPYYARFSMMNGPLAGRHYTLHQDTTTIGRVTGNDICIPDLTVSRQHAVLRFENGGWVLEDKNSANGTFINGTRIHSPQPLREGDQIRFGDEMVMFNVVQ
jgi:hypothetical protein